MTGGVTTDVVDGSTVVSGELSESVVTPTVGTLVVVGVVMTLVVEDTTVE